MHWWLSALIFMIYARTLVREWGNLFVPLGWHWNTSVGLPKSVGNHNVNFVSQRIPFCFLDNKEWAWLNNCLPSLKSVKYFIWVQWRAGVGLWGLSRAIGRISSNSVFSDQWFHIGSQKVAAVGETTPQTLAETTKQGSLCSPMLLRASC